MTREDDELGTVRLCPRCGEWWPQDEEFYWPRRDRDGGWQCYCRACDYERRKGVRLASRVRTDEERALNNARHRQRRLGPEREAILARGRAAARAYYERNGEAVRERERQRRERIAAAEGRTIRRDTGRPRIEP